MLLILFYIVYIITCNNIIMVFSDFGKINIYIYIFNNNSTTIANSLLKQIVGFSGSK